MCLNSPRGTRVDKSRLASSDLRRVVETLDLLCAQAMDAPDRPEAARMLALELANVATWADSTASAGSPHLRTLLRQLAVHASLFSGYLSASSDGDRRTRAIAASGRQLRHILAGIREARG
jgi:hypothetical protein